MTYTVSNRDGCTLIAGSVPARQFVALTAAAGDGAVLSDDLARLAGVQFAWGSPADVDALTAKLRAERLAYLATPSAGTPRDGLSDAARRWLAVGSQGMSSCSIFWKLTGVKPDYIADDRGYSHPHDPDDLLRCMRMIDAVPEFKGRIGEMAGCSREWAALAAHWDDLCKTLTDEAPDWLNPNCRGQAKQTYDKMKAVLRGARDAGR